MWQQTITAIANDLRLKKYSAVELTQNYLARIKKYDQQLNSFITITEEMALAQAKQADQLLHQGMATALTGIPIAHKDLFCTKDVKTSCGSKILANFIAPYDATVVSKLQQAGMVMLGKTNMDEFAMGTSNETSFYGPTKNPWNLAYSPGGSSGGATAAIAARLVPAATGSDSGGSIRQPASLSGVCGLKPTYNLVSRYGMIAFASSFDHAGPIANSAEDLALLLNYLVGADAKDLTCVVRPTINYLSQLNEKISGIKIGIPVEYFDVGLDTKVRNKINSAIDELKKLGVIFKEIKLQNSKLAPSVYYVIAPAECSSNLSRFDGVRYGFRCDNPQDIADLYQRTRSEGFGEEVKRRIMIGTYVLSAGYFAAYYLKAQQVRNLIKADFQAAFQEVDLILSPTTPTPAFKLGEKLQDPISMYLNDIYTVAANLAGLPALSIPVGFVDNLPVGLQLIAPHFQEAKILNVAHQYQQVTDWHQQIPQEFIG